MPSWSSGKSTTERKQSRKRGCRKSVFLWSKKAPNKGKELQAVGIKRKTKIPRYYRTLYRMDTGAIPPHPHPHPHPLKIKRNLRFPKKGRVSLMVFSLTSNGPCKKASLLSKPEERRQTSSTIGRRSLAKTQQRWIGRPRGELGCGRKRRAAGQETGQNQRFKSIKTEQPQRSKEP